MRSFELDEVEEDLARVLSEGGHEGSEMYVAERALANSEEVARAEYADALLVWACERPALSTDVLLKRCWRSSTHVDLPIEQKHCHQRTINDEGTKNKEMVGFFELSGIFDG